MTYEEKITWHKISKRLPYVLNCVMPDEGQDILIATERGVYPDVCGVDCDEYYLESGEDWDDVIAWAAMPKYKAGEQNEVN